MPKRLSLVEPQDAPVTAWAAGRLDGRASAAVQRRDGGYAWFVTAVMCLGFAFSFMDRSILQLLIAPLERSMHLSDTGISLLQGATFAIFYALFGIPLARVADNGHRRNLILIGVVVWCLATMGCGLARTLPQLFLARVVVAVGEAVLAPAAVSIIADYFSPGRRSLALSVYSMGVFFGGGMSLSLGGTLLRSLGANGVTPTPLGPLESWRIVFLVLGMAGLIMVPLLLAVREPHRAFAADAEDRRSSLREVAAEFVAKRRSLFACIVGFATIALGAQTLQAWAPTLFVRVHHWNLGGAGQRLGAFTIVLGPLGALSGAWIASRLERTGRAHGKLLVGTGSALAAAACSLAATLRPEGVAFAGAVLLQYFVAFNFGLVQAAIAELLPNRMRAMGSAAYIATSNLLSATLGPLLVGLLNDHLFHDPQMIAVSIRLVSPTFLVVAAVILWSGRASYHRHRVGA